MIQQLTANFVCETGTNCGSHGLSLKGKKLETLRKYGCISTLYLQQSSEATVRSWTGRLRQA